MRGKVAKLTARAFGKRITPAHAGKSVILILRDPALEDHPRPCGEKLIEDGGKKLKQGSPPPMRGKAAEKAAQDAAGRITPAHAGKSATRIAKICK